MRDYGKFQNTEKKEAGGDYKLFSGVDPRAADLPEDSALWDRLLSMCQAAEKADPESELPLTTGLVEMRLGGARIEGNGAGGYKLAAGAWESAAKYRTAGDRLLRPHVGLLKELMEQMAAEVPVVVNL